ncbi:hypothetical protein BDK51DRAFT_34798, partial [Blyttiomyces helicus]
DTEAQMDRLLEFRILKGWETLKLIRIDAGFASTDLKITPIETEIETELAELSELHDLLNLRLAREHEAKQAEWQKRHDEQAEAVRRRREEAETRRRIIEDHERGEELVRRRHRRKGSGGKGKGKKRRRPREGEEGKPDEDVDEGLGVTDAENGEENADPAMAEEGTSAPSAPPPTAPPPSKRKAKLADLIGRFRSRTPSPEKSAPPQGDAPTSPLGAVANTARDSAPQSSDEGSAGAGPGESEERGGRKKGGRSDQKATGSAPSLIQQDSAESLPIIEPPPGEFKPEKFRAKRIRAQIKKDEQNRRREIETTSVYARLFYNDKEVTRTRAEPLDSRTLGASFSVLEDPSVDGVRKEGKARRGAVFGLRVREVPESIRIEVYEMGAFGDSLLGQSFVAVPDPSENVRALDRDPTLLQFVGPQFVEHDSEVAPKERWIAGTIKLNAAWGVDEDGRSLGPVVCGKTVKDRSILNKPGDPLTSSGPIGRINIQKLMDWIENTRLDPNDPRNQDLLRLKQLVQAVHDPSDPAGATFHTYLTSRRFFRLGVPRWMEELVMGFR